MAGMERKQPEITRRDAVAIALLSGLLIAGVAIGYARDRARRRSVRVLPAPQERVYRVNVNSAKAAELELLPGIGRVRARRIVAYREQHGPFASVAALTKVPGISRTVVDRLAPFAEARSVPAQTAAQEQARGPTPSNPSPTP